MISIIVPTYKRLSALKRCVSSVISQNVPELELIVIDDFSNDGTSDYLAQVATEHSFIRIISNKENFGVNYSRNRGIEIASQKYILFLDSDDSLKEHSLQKIQTAIKADEQAKHYLFIVSDRAEEFEHADKVKPIQYEDWLMGTVSGDFTHVVLSAIMKKYLFFEEFRMFEHLNWLRIKKETDPQLMVNIVVTERERSRADSLTLSSKLQNAAVIESKFDSENMYYSLYHKDLKKYSPQAFNFKLIYTILLGVACNKKEECRSLIKFAGKKSVKAVGNMLMLVPGSLVQYGIIRYSGMKRN